MDKITDIYIDIYANMALYHIRAPVEGSFGGSLVFLNEECRSRSGIRVEPTGRSRNLVDKSAAPARRSIRR